MNAVGTEDAGGQLEEIVVSAQKRSQNVQDVPVSVTAFSADALKNSNIDRVEDLSQLDASAALPAKQGVVTPFIRGIGNTLAGFSGNEASVPVYMDGVYFTRLDQALLQLSNIQRVEILKGPQGTLFGRNASGGAVQILTRDPGADREFQAEAGYASYDTVTGKLYAASPLSDDISADFALSGQYQGKGWGDNLTNGDDTGLNRYYSARSKIVIKGGDNTTIRLIGHWAWDKNEQGVPSTLIGPDAPSDRYDTNSTFTPSVRYEGGGLSADVTHGFEFADLVSISAFRDAEQLYRAEGDYVAPNFAQYELNSVDTQVSQEFQLKSKSNSEINWIGGLYYLYSKQGYDPARVTGDAITANGGQRQDIYGLQWINSYAAFGQTTFPLVKDKTNLTLGLRYSNDFVEGKGRQDFVTAAGVFPGGASFDKKEFEFSKITYRLALDHHVTDNVMAYASISRGYKSGTFNTLPLTTEPAKPEVVDAYELGIKSELLERRLRLNAAVFWNDIKDPQVQAVFTSANISSVGVVNAKSARTRGAEILADAVLSDDLTLNLSTAYIDSEYRKFANAPFVFAVENGTCPAANPNDPAQPAASGAQLCPVVPRDASGNRMIQVPEWRTTAGITYEKQTGVGAFTANANAAYTGSIAWEADNKTTQGGYTLVNLALSYEPLGGEHWRFTLWGRNVTDTEYRYNLTTLNVQVVSPGAPATYGLTAQYRF